MTRFNILLLIALLLSSVYLVGLAHDTRRIFTELDRARAEERLLDNEYERMKSEKQSQATPLRVERTARDKLAMRPATPAVTEYVVYSRAASAPRPPGKAP